MLQRFQKSLIALNKAFFFANKGIMKTDSN